MKLSISNIGWDATQDDIVYNLMKQYGFCGIEIAPTRIFPDNPYERLDEASLWCKDIKSDYGFIVSSIQSIWYGRQEKIFGSKEERDILIDYTKKTVDFAKSIECKNIVFGCPRNRVKPDILSKEDIDDIEMQFFEELGEYALKNETVIAIEANPPIYNTNYIITTKEALDLIKKVNSKGLLLNLDVGTMIENSETVTELADNIEYINHVHISEPGLKMIQERPLHMELFDMLKKERYDKYVSIEMGKQEDISALEQCIKYVSGIFH